MNANENIFFKRFDGATRKIFFEDKDKYMVLSWIIFKTNYQEEYQGLKKNECYFSYSVVEDECNVSRKKLQRILLDLEIQGFITWIYKSKGKDKKSVIFLIETGYGSENGSGYSSRYSKIIENTDVKNNKDTVINTVRDMVEDTSSRNISRNISNNIYSANDIENIWSLYPNKKGKSIAIKKIPKILQKYGKEQLERCITRYSNEIEGKDKQYILNGSTFFNNRYEDYLDNSFLEILPKAPVRDHKVTNFEDE